MTALFGPPDEAALIADAQGGDGAAFGELVRRHHQAAYSLALRLVSDHDEASDITQEAMIRAWKGLRGFRGDASFGTWLHRITVNTAWSWRRRAARHASDEIDAGVAGLTVDDAGHPERMGEAFDLRPRLLAALDRLSDGAREVVIKKDVLGWTHTEIAESLGITVTATKVRLHRARARLQRELEGVR